jgi:vacuolar-type H+-ATPase subunit B/Vma2
MTNEEMEQYCSDNEPTEIKRDRVERWIERIWHLTNSIIIERYTYKYDENTLIENTDTTKYRDAFNVVSIDREGVLNG